MDPCIRNLLGAVAFSQADLLLVVCVLLLIVFSAFFSASEIAFSTSNSIRLYHYAENKTKGARKALYITENFDKTLSTILVGNNIVNILSTTLCAYLFAKIFTDPSIANLMNTVVMTLLILIFGEITPKALAKRSPEKYAMAFSGILYFFMIVFTPLTCLLNGFQKIINKKKGETENPTVTEDELESIIDTMEEEGVIDESNADIIQGAINLSSTTAYDIMTPRVDMVCIDKNASVDDLIKIFLDKKFSRIPVFEETKDSIIGVINQKDFFAKYFAENKKQHLTITKLMKEVNFIPETVKVDDLLRQMQEEKIHMSIVVDEHGGTSGLVTLEDCLEQVFGQIYDEHDEEEQQLCKKIEDNHYLLNAEITIEELFEILEIEHIPDSEYNSLAGFLLEKSESMVSENTVITVDTIDDVIDKVGNITRKNISMQFTVTKMDNNRILEVDLKTEYKIGTENDEPEEN